jgi:tetratricopeptide (TPR) repeat protein
MRKATPLLLILCALLSSASASLAQTRSQIASEAFTRAVNQMKSGQFELARPTFERLVKDYPNDLEARNNLAVCLIKARRFSEAEDHLKYILVADPEKAGSQQNIGVARQGLTRMDEALADTNKAVELYQNQKNAEIAAALFNKGWLLDEQGKLKEAIEAYRESVKLKADYGKAWLGLAIALAKDKQFAEAKKAMDEASKLKDSNAQFTQLVSDNRTALEKAMEQSGFVMPVPVSFWSVGLIGSYNLYHSRPVLTVIGYILAHLIIFGAVQVGIRAYFIAPLTDDQMAKDFFICLLLGALLFLLGWGYAHWITLIIVAFATGLLGALASQ